VNLAVLATTLIVLAVVLEAGARLFSDVQAPVWTSHPRLGKVYIPEYAGVVYNGESDRDIPLRFNRDGFRGPERALAKPVGTRRVAFMGDSFVAAVACLEEETAVHRLEERLNGDDPAVRWEVLGFGVSGFSTAQELVAYTDIASKYDPDIVIGAYAVRNDFADNSRHLTTFQRLYFDLDADGRLVEIPPPAGKRRASAWLNAHSRFYVWWKQANDILRAEGRETGALIFRTDPDADAERAWEVNLALIEAFHEAVVSRGARFLLVLYPSADQVYDELWLKLEAAMRSEGMEIDRGLPERRIGEFCARRGIEILSLVEPFREAAAGRSLADSPPGEALYFPLGGHYTPAANLLAARLIHARLAKGEDTGRQENPGAEASSPSANGPPAASKSEAGAGPVIRP
jgi:hypothetical protein